MKLSKKLILNSLFIFLYYFGNGQNKPRSAPRLQRGVNGSSVCNAETIAFLKCSQLTICITIFIF